MKKILTLLVFAMPAARAKNFLLRRLGHPVHPTARIGPSLVLGVGRFDAGPGVSVVFGNVFRGLTTVTLAEDAIIGQFNWFSTATMFVGTTPESATLTLGEGAAVVSRHYVDCSGGVTLDRFSIVAGVRSVLLTHQVSHVRGTQECAPIRIGQYSQLNAANRMVPGSVLPARSLTGIGAVVLPGLTEPARLYAGVPAKDVKSVDGSKLFTRTNAVITR